MVRPLHSMSATHPHPAGISTHTSWMRTASSCRTIARVIRSAYSVSAIPASRFGILPHDPARILPWSVHRPRACGYALQGNPYSDSTDAALLHTRLQVGLLPRDNQEQIAFAYKLYTREDEEGITLAAGFKRAFCHNVQVEFMGVW